MWIILLHHYMLWCDQKLDTRLMLARIGLDGGRATPQSSAAASPSLALPPLCLMIFIKREYGFDALSKDPQLSSEQVCDLRVCLK